MDNPADARPGRAPHRNDVAAVPDRHTGVPQPIIGLVPRQNLFEALDQVLARFPHGLPRPAQFGGRAIQHGAVGTDRRLKPGFERLGQEGSTRSAAVRQGQVLEPPQLECPRRAPPSGARGDRGGAAGSRRFTLDHQELERAGVDIRCTASARMFVRQVQPGGRLGDLRQGVTDGGRKVEGGTSSGDPRDSEGPCVRAPPPAPARDEIRACPARRE